jgi:hypothetical protein
MVRRPRGGYSGIEEVAMRFILLRIATDDTAEAIPDTGRPPVAKALSSMAVWRSDLENAGVLLAHEAFLPPALGARVFVEGGEARVLAPPFKDVREVLHGYWLLEVDSLREAIGWARRCPAETGFLIEVRQVDEPADSQGRGRKATVGFRSTIPLNDSEA